MTSAGRLIARTALVALAASVLSGLGVLVLLPRIVHGAALTVLTGSMQPALPVGSVVIERPADPGALRVGDVATYRQHGHSGYVTHRIVAVDRTTNPPTFTFKGDANPIADTQPVAAGAIRGTVWFDVPYVGRLRRALGSGGPRSLAVGLGVLGLSLYSACQLAGGLREHRRGRVPDRDAVPVPASTA